MRCQSTALLLVRSNTDLKNDNKSSKARNVETIVCRNTRRAYDRSLRADADPTEIFSASSLPAVVKERRKKKPRYEVELSGLKAQRAKKRREKNAAGRIIRGRGCRGRGVIQRTQGLASNQGKSRIQHLKTKIISSFCLPCATTR